jgi:phosphatidylserine/phosphatidylglycerophosphate/cardiolipin synthase-like enzyme
MIYIEPNAGVAPVLTVLADARHNINLNGYLLDNRAILSALEAAHARGVDVRVMIEGKPYDMKPWQVKKEAAAIQAAGAIVRYAPPRFETHGSHWAFNHGKWVCSNHQCEIGSPNYTYAGFGSDRDYLVVTGNRQVVQAANAVFNADWHNQRSPAYAHQVLVISPGSQPQLMRVLQQPGSLDIEAEEVGYAPAILNAIAAKGKLARVIVPANISSKDRRNLENLQSHCVQVRFMPVHPLYIHAKMWVANTMAFVGSVNISDVSINNNREMGLLLGGRDIGILQAQFNRDWARAGG